MSGHAAPDPDDADIFVGRLRVPPQNEQWVALFNSAEFERLGMNIGVSRTTFRLHVLSGVRSQTYTTTPAVDSKARTTEDAGWLRSQLLARAAHTSIQRHLFSVEGVVQVTYLGRTQQAPRRNFPDVYEIESRYDIMLRTENATFTT